MFDIAPAELLILGVVAIAVIPPKDLPRAMRTAGQWISKVRGVARQFRSGFDEIIRESEIQDMEKKWRAENERIMREHSPSAFPQDDHPTPAPAFGPAALPSYADDDREVAPVPPIVRPVVPDEHAAAETTPQPVIGETVREPSSAAGSELPPLDRST